MRDHKLVEQELQKITADEGFEFASTMLQANPDIMVWLGPDDTVLGVDAFLKSKKQDPATNKNAMQRPGRDRARGSPR